MCQEIILMQGAITQASASRINSDSGTLTLDVASGNGITGTYQFNIWWIW